MEFDVSYDFENEQQFWDELHETVSRECATHSLIDDALRSYLALTTNFKGEYVNSDYDFARCSYKLHTSALFEDHPDYVRRQIVQCLLQDENPSVLQVAASFLLADARENELTFELLNKEGAFPRLVDLISAPREDNEAAMHRLLMELLYEMSRIQKITSNDLMHVQDEFILGLFQIIEQVSDDVTDPYHYPVIRVLLVLNEQFMVTAHDPMTGNGSSMPLTNKVMKVLSSHGNKFKTFGENIILLLNREDETSLQLLTLKLLYLLFTTPQTYEYFYTNDLRVLVDILIRNLLDLPEEASALRHTYLRVLYPLLAHTQLRQPPQYKREEIRKLLTVLARGQSTELSIQGAPKVEFGHFGEIDETTKRLVNRCRKVSWLVDPDTESIDQVESPVEDRSSAPTSPTSPSKHPPALPAPRKLTKRNSSKGSTLTIGPYLTPHLEGARQSSLSMMEMAAQREKPGVITPSRNPSLKHNLRAAIMLGKREKPPPPKARRSGLHKSKESLQLHEENLTATASAVKTDKEKLEIQPTPPAVPEHTRPTTSPRQEPPEPSVSPTIVKVSPKPVSTPPTLSSPPRRKPPPPTPKARRWRGKGRRDDEGGAREPGKFDSNLPSLAITRSHDLSPREISPFSPAEKTLASPTSIALGPIGPTSSVTAALNEAQAEAISEIGQTLENVHLNSNDAGLEQEQEQEQQASIAVIMEEYEHPPMVVVEHQPPPPQQRVILAPPGLAPPRAVPGPRWELERSPFLSDDDYVDVDGEKDGERDGSSDEEGKQGLKEA